MQEPYMALPNDLWHHILDLCALEEAKILRTTCKMLWDQPASKRHKWQEKCQRIEQSLTRRPKVEDGDPTDYHDAKISFLSYEICYVTVSESTAWWHGMTWWMRGRRGLCWGYKWDQMIKTEIMTAASPDSDLITGYFHPDRCKTMMDPNICTSVPGTRQIYNKVDAICIMS